LLSVAAAAVAGPGCSGSSDRDVSEIARYLTALMRHPQEAAEIGDAYVKLDATVGPLSSSQLTELILQESGLGSSAELSVSLDEVGARIKDKVHQDFLDERVVEVNGWLLSRTEAMLCALVRLQRSGAS
jgi:hypothetical protein